MTLSLRELLGIVVAVAVGLVALIKAAAWSTSLVVLIAWMAWTACTILAFINQSKLQRFAVGFSIAAASYAIVSYFTADGYGDHIFTTETLLNLFYDTVAEVEYGEWSSPSGEYRSRQETWAPDLDDFYMTGRSLFVLLFGYLGGKFASFIYHRNQTMGT